jgi:hypothetical protein
MGSRRCAFNRRTPEHPSAPAPALKLFRRDDITIACPASLAENNRPFDRAAHACKADLLLTGDLRDFGPFMNQPQRTGGLLIQTVASFLDGL